MLPERIDRITYHQDDLITRSQALAAGASVDMLRHACRPGGRWQVVLPGVYATFTGALSQVHRLRAALLHGGPNAMITGATACRLAGLQYVVDTGMIDVLVPHRRQAVDLDFTVLRRTHRLPEPWYWIGSDDANDGIEAAAEGAGALVDAARRWNIPIAPLPRAALDAIRFHHGRAVTQHGTACPGRCAACCCAAPEPYPARWFSGAAARRPTCSPNWPPRRAEAPRSLGWPLTTSQPVATRRQSVSYAT